ncbi:hypothetical protein COCCADRAFT_109469, partial [Bipolaris zeicola 26-R-13]
SIRPRSSVDDAPSSNVGTLTVMRWRLRCMFREDAGAQVPLFPHHVAEYRFGEASQWSSTTALRTLAPAEAIWRLMKTS